MNNFFFYPFEALKEWWLGSDYSEIDEFERIESKHTRVRYDEDLYEIIRIH